VPTTYAEPKGLFALEAMACGVPLVQPRHGAFPEMIEKTGGGLLVEPQNAKSLAEGLLRLIGEPELTEKLGRNGYEGVRRYYSAGQMADHALDAYRAVMNNQV